jgi:hypothetical protein
MLRTIAIYGSIAGIISGALLATMTLTVQGSALEPYGVAIGYTTMLIALSTIFVAVKRRRDRELGGVITFWQGLAIGLGISVIAGIFYAVAWEMVMPFMAGDFMADWTQAMIAEQKAKGASAAELARTVREMEQLRADYANPLYRMPMSFTEIFPVGALVSFVTAALLRNPRFLPARAPVPA